MVLKKYGRETSENIEWANSRLLCIAGDYTKYDEYAVEQINRNIELIRYRKFDDGIILFELVNAISAVSPAAEKTDTPVMRVTVEEFLNKMGAAEKDRYEDLKAFIMTLGDDVQEKITKHYIAFKRLYNFACFEFHPNDKEILIFLKIDPTTVALVEGFSRDVRKIGHFGTGDLELRIKSDEDAIKAQELIRLSYENS
jgi:predicted transport protein